MKNRFPWIITGTLCLITTGFFGNTYQINHMYNQTLESQISGECHLTAVNILNDVNDSISVPINVSRTMASDQLLEDYLAKEPVSDEDLTQEYVDGLQTYLNTYYEKFHYDSIFLVSTKTGRYYHQDGIDRVLKEGNPENVWYFDFLKSDQNISLDVDNDEANNDAVSLFIDCKVNDANKQTIGVVGVGMKIQSTVDQIAELANQNALKAYIISEDGQLQVTSEKNIDFDTEYIFSHEDISEEQLKELLATPGEGVWRTSNGQKEYLETIQIPNVNWYLMISMTNIDAFAKNDARSKTLYALMAGFLILLFVLTYLLFKKMHTIELDDASKDELTGLYNRTATGKVLNLETKEGFAKYGTLFIMDVDDFKTINDTGGHTFGDEVLEKVADALQKTVGKKGVAIRWGGDEFIGIFTKEEAMPEEALKKLMQTIEQIPLKDGKYVSGSFGAVKLNDMDFQQAVIAADHAMYDSKNNGKKCLTWYEAEK